MSGLLNSSLNGSTSNLPDGAGRTFTSFSSQSGAASPIYQHTGVNTLLESIILSSP
ncbi:hypothetical protein MtrunA17_Chr2g0327681 [Medicago truncatula]|uniref:Uncharacterized protein n=1 Tax=Medicago truncatula TaxID=3880 RepID=A0A396JI50_MEDTR|nr:hypothetical protein MtrunA17_Chr2g0327681 [Medicago truncatula]